MIFGKIKNFHRALCQKIQFKLFPMHIAKIGQKINSLQGCNGILDLNLPILFAMHQFLCKVAYFGQWNAFVLIYFKKRKKAIFIFKFRLLL